VVAQLKIKAHFIAWRRRERQKRKGAERRRDNLPFFFELRAREQNRAGGLSFFMVNLY